MPNLYVTLDTLKGTGALNVGTGTALDLRLLGVLEGVSRQCDQYCGRNFFQLEATKTFNGRGTLELPVADLIGITSLKEDTNADGTFETTWDAADYLLWPYNADPTSDWGRPYRRLIVNESSNGTQDTFLKGQRNYQIVGTWGFQRVTKDSGLTGTIATTTGTALTLSGSASGTIEAGMTLRIGTAELMYVRSWSGTTATVTRGVNGSTAATATAVAVNVVVYPVLLQEAVIVQASRLWKRKDSAYASQVGLPETGQMLVWTGGLDPDVKALLNQGGLRRLIA